MKTPFYVSLAAGLLLAGCGGDSSQSGNAAATNAASTGSTPLTAPADYVGALGKAKQLAEKTSDLATLNQAVQMFHVEKGRFPKDLDELVSEKYIPKVPPAPYGMKLAYDATTGKVSMVKQ
ncbi:MAG TPA: hypothetical protein VMU04_21005 [Candidatus Acidoferrum sp.]|nr:hypothetical protein [Candidatus Acidoferrum sp.]